MTHDELVAEVMRLKAIVENFCAMCGNSGMMRYISNCSGFGYYTHCFCDCKTGKDLEKCNGVHYQCEGYGCEDCNHNGYLPKEVQVL